MFIDFKRAFGSIPHHKLWPNLLSLGLSSKIIRIIKSLYDTAFVQVRVGGLLTDPHPVTSGVLQGESLSPLLFIL